MTGLIPNLTFAYILDLFLGDPQWFPHPVRLIGFFIERGEKFFRKWIASEWLAGAVLTVGLTALSFAATHALLKILSGYSTVLSAAAEIFILYCCLSTKDLAVESLRVKNALKSQDIASARNKLSWIVGRDTDRLDEKEMVRATVETVAENTVDGIVSPLFFAVLGGAPLAIAYKTINTLDSMIGHKNEKYILFGRIAARIDTAVNWIPARISGFLFPIAAGILNFSMKKSYNAAWKEGAKSGVPNSGIPEAAMAGALQIQLGGLNFYKGKASETSKLGDPVRPLSVQNIDESICVMYAASILFFLFSLSARLILEKVFL